MKKILLVVVVIVVALFLSKDFIAASVFTTAIRSFTDLPAGVKSVKVGIFKNAAEINGFKLYNPKNAFKDRVMLDMPALYIDYDPGSFFAGTKHIRKINLNVKEFYVIKNEGGELNLDSLKAIQSKSSGSRGSKQEVKFKIDVLELKIGKVIYKDYTKGATPFVKEFNIGLDERYENIDNPYVFASLVVFKALANTGVSSLANYDIGPLKNAASDAVNKAVEGIKNLLPK
jgi:hypothetical protein